MRCIKLFAGIAVMGFLMYGAAFAKEASSESAKMSPQEVFKEADAGNANSQYAAAYLILVNHYSEKGTPNATDKDKAVKRAVGFLDQAVASGNAPAEHLLGTLYVAGVGVPKDLNRARELFQKAADAGNADAENALGEMLHSGQAGTVDDTAAVSWFMKATAQNHKSAMANLGFMYARGLGVPKDEKKAVELTQAAAKALVPAAEHNLGWMYETGTGVQKNLKEAVHWYLMAAEQGYGPAQLNVGFLYAKGEVGGDVRNQLIQSVKWFALASNWPDKTVSETAKKAVIYVAQNRPYDVVSDGMDAAKKWTYRH